MIHAATLVHDDVIDAAETRRGRPSTNVKWGNHTCVLAGDWLYMQAFQIALRERNFQILDLLIGLTQMMVEGELLQLERIGRIDVSEADCMELVDRKTACLFSVCARLGAICRHTPTPQTPGKARRVRLESRHGVPVGGRRARFHRARKDARQAGRRRSARRQSHAAAGLRAGTRHARRARPGGDDPARAQLRRSALRAHPGAARKIPRHRARERARPGLHRQGAPDHQRIPRLALPARAAAVTDLVTDAITRLC